MMGALRRGRPHYFEVVLLAVAKAAVSSGVARKPIADEVQYGAEL